MPGKCSGEWMLPKNSTQGEFTGMWFEPCKLQLVSIKTLICWLIQNCKIHRSKHIKHRWFNCSLGNNCSRKQCPCLCWLHIWLVYIEVNTSQTQQNSTLPYQQWPDNSSGSAGWKSLGHGNLSMEEEWGKKSYYFFNILYFL